MCNLPEKNTAVVPRVDCDPYGTFSNGNSSDSDACMWLGVHCVDSKVQIPHRSPPYSPCVNPYIEDDVRKLSLLNTLSSSRHA